MYSQTTAPGTVGGTVPATLSLGTFALAEPLQARANSGASAPLSTTGGHPGRRESHRHNRVVCVRDRLKEWSVCAFRAHAPKFA